MSSNPKSSPWYSTPRASRRRRGIELTLSPEAVAVLDRLAAEKGEPRSRVVEAWLIAIP